MSPPEPETEAEAEEAWPSFPPEAFQAQAVLDYDADRFDFRKALLPVLQEPEDCDLSQLHNGRYGREILACFLRKGTALALGPRCNPWNRRFHSCMQREPLVFGQFLEVYRDFVRHFVLDHLQTDRIAFQTLPTFRCHLPGCGAPGRPHRDEDYFHPCCEVNFWVPVTAVSGSNSLYAESRRGAGDFQPFEVPVGKLVRFFANQVWHYTLPNETDRTRISLDFRVIREEEWSAAAFRFFQLGRHYTVMTREGVLPKDSEELQRLCKAFDCLGAPRKPPKRPDPPAGDSPQSVVAQPMAEAAFETEGS